MENQVSHYKILEKIGEGGMGVVYKAEDTRLKRIVALKFLPRQTVLSEEDKARFFREARASALLDHSNICTVHDIDEFDGQTFIVMAFIEGTLLKEKIKKGQLTIDEVLNIGIQLAEGLAEAHRKGIIHRDIKSSNIMITEKGQVKIMDFGLAKSSQLTQITTEGTRLGTVAYMSPEQIRGEEADFRTDIWSLGVVLYEMLTGKLPFAGENMQSVMYSILSNEPALIQNLRPETPPEIIWIIRKAMTKDLSSRYQSMSEMCADLKALKTDSGSRITETLPACIRPKSKKRLLKRLAFAIGIVIIVVVAYYLLSDKSHMPLIKSIAVLPFRDLSPAKDQEYFCDGMTEAIIGNLSKIQEFKVISRTSIMRYKNSDKNVKEIGSELSVDTILEGSIQREDSKIRLTAQLINVQEDTHIWSEIYNRKIESVFEVQDDVSRAIAGALKVKLSPLNIESFRKGRTSNVEAYEQYLKGIFNINSKYINTGNEEEFNTALKYFNKAIDLDNTYALAYYGLAWAYEAKFTFTHEEKYRDLVIENCQKAFLYQSDLPEANAAIGWVYFERGDLDNAYKSFKRALASNTSNSEIYHMAAVFLEGIGLHLQAIKMNTRALELDPLYLYTYVNRAWDYIATGDLDKAKKDYEMARKIAPGNASILRGSSLLATIMGEYDLSQKFISEADRIETGKTAVVRALLLAARDKNKEALNLTKDDRIYLLLGMKKEALDYLEEVIKKGNYKQYQYSYLALLNSVFHKPLFNEQRSKNILKKQKETYDSLLRKYGDLYK